MARAGAPAAVRRNGMSRQQLNHLDGAIRLWSQLAEGLRQGGYAEAAPEYLRFSQMLRQSRLDEIEAGGGSDEEKWSLVRQLGGIAYEYLLPLVESARIVSELPEAPARRPAAAAAGVSAVRRKAGGKAATARKGAKTKAAGKAAKTKTAGKAAKTKTAGKGGKRRRPKG